MRKSRNLIDRPVCPTECARVNLGRKRNNAFGLYRRLMNFKSDQLTAPNAARVHRELMPHRIANWLSGVSSSSSSSSSSSLSLGDASLNLNGVFNECRSRSVCFRAQASNARPNTASSMDSLSFSLSLSPASLISRIRFFYQACQGHAASSQAEETLPRRAATMKLSIFNSIRKYRGLSVPLHPSRARARALPLPPLSAAPKDAVGALSF